MNKLLFGSIVLSPFLAVACNKEQDRQPNILFILSDDHALAAISAYGSGLSALAPTPNIDRIANGGAMFWGNYCCNSISGPSRASILTGKHSHMNGFMQNSNKAFDGNQNTLPKVLGANGYQTALIGKWHLVSTPTGFDHWQILMDQGDYNHPDFITAGDTTRYDGYVTDIITGFTTQWLDSRDKNKPFFLMMNHKAPHRNWVPDEKYYRLFENTEFPVPDNYFDDYEGRKAAALQKMNIYRDMYEGHDLKMTDGPDSDKLLFDPWPHVWMGRMSEKEQAEFFDAYRERNNAFYSSPKSEKEIALWKYQRYMQDYLATIRSVDDSVGEVLDYLEEHGLRENTIVVYASDQGFYLGEHGWFDKRFMYEESMIMPLLISYPKSIKPGTEVKLLTQNIDFMPTLLDMCSVDIPEDVQGVSFRPLLEGREPAGWRTSLYYHFYEFPGFHSVRAHYGIKTERYKLICFYKDKEWEFYDLHDDPEEMNNIYGDPEYEAIISSLRAELTGLQDKYEVPEIYRN